MSRLANDGISLIVPVYNIEDYIARSIESILEQTFDNFELVLVNDGSTDKTGEICDLYAAKDGRVKVIHKENGGGGAARKTGIDAAEGKYIMFMDGDDAFTNDALEKAHNAIVEQGVDILQFGYYKVESIEEAEPFGTGEVKHFDAKDALLQIMVQKSPKMFNNLLWCKIYKSEIVKKPEYNLTIRTNNDAPMIARIFYYAEKVATLDVPLYYYIQRKDEKNQSITYNLLKSREKFITSHIRTFSDIASFFKEKDLALYKAALKNLLAFALSAIKEKGLSKQGKRQAFWVIKQHKIRDNSYIPFKKKVAIVLMKVLGVFINTKDCKI